MKNSIIKIIPGLLLISVLLFACSTEINENSEIQLTETGINSGEWVKIPAGEFYKGIHAHEANINYDYEIMLTHVTNSQFVGFLNSAVNDGKITVNDTAVLGYYPGDEFFGYNHEIEILEGNKLLMPLIEAGMHIQYINQKFEVDKGYENHPVIMITWFGAKAYADYYGWRLPSENEWEKAARGTDKRAYPWGNEINKQNANYFNNRYKIEKSIENHARTTPVGFFNGNKYGDFETVKSLSPYGLYDMAGNVWQWVGDDYPDIHYRFMRGGSYQNYDYNLRVWAKNNAGPDYYSIWTGFRCARDIVEKEELPPSEEELIIDITDN